jgi:hypothetical protein
MYDNFGAFEAAVKAEWNRILATKPGWYTVATQDVEIQDAWEMYLNTRESLLREQLLGETKMRTNVPLLQNFGTASGTETTAERGTLVVETKNKGKTTKTYIGADRITAKVDDTEKEDMLRRGSVLNDGWWWTFKNDAWVMGCVHGLKVMQLSKEGLAQLSDLDDLVWDASAKRPRVLGRELIGLHAAGYKRIVHFSYKEVEVDDPRAPKTVNGKPAPKVKKKIAFEKEGSIALLGLTFAPVTRDAAQGLTFKAYYDAIARFTKIDQLRELLSSTSAHGVAYDAYEFPKEAQIVTPQQAQTLQGPTLTKAPVTTPNKSLGTTTGQKPSWAAIASGKPL